MNTVGLAKAIMKLGEVRPASPLKEIGACQEVFRHERFVRAACAPAPPWSTAAGPSTSW